MKSFLVGLLVISLIVILAVVGILLLPLLFVVGFFLRWILLCVVLVFVVWLVGKITLIAIEDLVRREKRHDDKKSRARKSGA